MLKEYYHRPRGVKAVDRRASLLPGEYLAKARAVNTNHNGVLAGVEGPVARKFSSFPRLQSWVFGAFNEVSQDVHNLVAALARARRSHELRLERVRTKSGRMEEIGAIAILTGQIWRKPILTAARESARCRVPTGLEESRAARSSEKERDIYSSVILVL